MREKSACIWRCSTCSALTVVMLMRQLLWLCRRLWCWCAACCVAWWCSVTSWRSSRPRRAPWMHCTPSTARAQARLWWGTRSGATCRLMPPPSTCLPWHKWRLQVRTSACGGADACERSLCSNDKIAALGEAVKWTVVQLYNLYVYMSIHMLFSGNGKGGEGWLHSILDLYYYT